jgi:diketogulonate reductase-like aldo/keto reductase
MAGPRARTGLRHEAHTPAKSRRTAYGGADSADDERAAFQASLAAGVNFLDTAAMYSGGASEQRLGELAQGHRDDRGHQVPTESIPDGHELLAALDESLNRLRRAQIDLYQHHFPSPWINIAKLMDQMADVVEAGKVTAVRVSNYSAQQMRIAREALARRGVPLASNQVEYSLVHRRPEVNGVLDACEELDVTLIAYQSLASGALTGEYASGPPTEMAQTLPADIPGRRCRRHPAGHPTARGDRRTLRQEPSGSGPALAHREQAGRANSGRKNPHSGGTQCGSPHVHPDADRNRGTQRFDGPVADHSQAVGSMVVRAARRPAHLCGLAATSNPIMEADAPAIMKGTGPRCVLRRGAPTLIETGAPISCRAPFSSGEAGGQDELDVGRLRALDAAVASCRA